MKTEKSPKAKTSRTVTRTALFPISVLAIYGVLFFLAPDKASLALKSCGNIFLNMLIPLSVVFALLLATNLFLKPAHIVKFLGGKPGIRGFTLSSIAGIISMGPIYTWYPLLKDLREKGAGNFPIAVFLYSRAVKPFLLPVMISCFGWIYAVVLSVITILGSFVVGYFMHLLVKEKTVHNPVTAAISGESEH
ncbi:MAG: permease [Dehalococcoidia bacterium]|nr:permease [Dehalococcoidia bacterium]